MGLVMHLSGIDHLPNICKAPGLVTTKNVHVYMYVDYRNLFII
jgi:hypothetical protein